MRPAQEEHSIRDATDSGIIGRIPFTDGIERDVFEDAEGRQHVIGYDGEPVFGVRLPPADEPLAVNAPSSIRPLRPR